MSYLLDTNVVSETIRKQANRQVTGWLEKIPPHALFVSVLTMGEIRRGIDRLPDDKKRKELAVWLEHELPAWFEDRVLPIDLAVADRWGRLLAQVGRPVPSIDSLLAATALKYKLRLVTRNAKDFDYPGLEVIDPWQSTP